MSFDDSGGQYKVSGAYGSKNNRSNYGIWAETRVAMVNLTKSLGLYLF